MPRPIKNNADWFSHDADMRNDARVKALRRKFNLKGYAIYNMLIETLVDADYFQIELNDLTYELLSGDFDIDSEELKVIVDYCISIDLFQVTDTYLRCKSLDKRLETLLSKRESDRNRVIEKLSQRKLTDNTHSKVKNSKEENSIVDISIKNIFETLTSTKQLYFEDIHRTTKAIYSSAEDLDTIGTIRHFLILKDNTEELNKPLPQIISHLKNWINKQSKDKISEYGKKYKEYARSIGEVS
jgi:hypothetical protein